MPRTNLFISSANIPASQKSDNGSRLRVYLDRPIDIGGNYCRLLKASLWYTMPNVSSTIGNDKMEFTYNSVYTLFTFPKGLYSLSDINETLSEKLVNVGFPLDLIAFVGDESTNLVTMSVRPAAPFTITFSSVNNTLVRNLLGFMNTGTVSITTPFNIDSTNTARVNLVNSIYVFCSFVGSNNYFGQKSGSACMAQTFIDVPPGGQLLVEDNNPVACETTGNLVSEFSVWLTDERLNPLDMSDDEPWTLLIELYPQQ